MENGKRFSTSQHYLVTSHNACTTPGKNRTRHRTILIIRSLPIPLFKKTAIGGKNIARIISTTLFIDMVSILEFIGGINTAPVIDLTLLLTKTEPMQGFRQDDSATFYFTFTLLTMHVHISFQTVPTIDPSVAVESVFGLTTWSFFLLDIACNTINALNNRNQFFTISLFQFRQSLFRTRPNRDVATFHTPCSRHPHW